MTVPDLIGDIMTDLAELCRDMRVTGLTEDEVLARLDAIAAKLESGKTRWNEECNEKD